MEMLNKFGITFIIKLTCLVTFRCAPGHFVFEFPLLKQVAN
jgi:hypothetical protein